MQKILICDSDELFRSNLRSVLKSEDYYIQEASRPSEAVKYVLKEKFDVIVFSLLSEDTNGIQIFSAIKAIDYKLPIIVVTDSNEPLSSVSSIIHESFRLFQKPVDRNEIEEAIREAVKVKVDNK
ncbi:MAG: Transcriptional regulatory protein QseF [Candidatus Scalindua arabica]|uniref:Transcriptional regulatory protein QseF n=1 Tax=Candidatus Scalindua arabica TaxID=1127984 RepID=A0A942A101_9BACT|nr:Transcriptional regulatory protein QseF [Candidatus Scalindua arabica]